jgi:hypothetical protein
MMILALSNPPQNYFFSTKLLTFFEHWMFPTTCNWKLKDKIHHLFLMSLHYRGLNYNKHCLPFRTIGQQACLIQSNLASTTLVYTTPSILRHIFARPNFLVQNSLFYTTMTLDNTTFRACILSY